MERKAGLGKAAQPRRDDVQEAAGRRQGGHRRSKGDPADAGPAVHDKAAGAGYGRRSEEHTSELQSLMRISYAVFCLKKKKNTIKNMNKKAEARQRETTV